MKTHRTIYLVRHGQYDPEVKDEPHGSGLTPVGREQAERTAEHLAQIPFAAVHTSTLTRALQTAEIIASRHPHLALQQTDLLKEITPPLPYLALKHMKDISLEQIQKDRLQAEEVIRRYLKPAGETPVYEAIVCHGNLIRYLVCRALQISPLIWMNLETYNCSISVLEIDPHGNMILLSYNESGHLPEELKTQNLSPMGVGRKYAEPDREPGERTGEAGEQSKDQGGQPQKVEEQSD